MSDREIAPTRSAFLELKEEREGMREGYGFLDEKRLILAAEILAELTRYEQERAAFDMDYAKAAGALRAALARHGLGGLTLYPADPAVTGEIRVRTRSVLGVEVQRLDGDVGGRKTNASAVNPSPEAEYCREVFRGLVPRVARLAAMAGNLERLRSEYSRTSRRARALEDVLLPEIDDHLKAIDIALEELEREEAVRVRQVNRGA